MMATQCPECENNALWTSTKGSTCLFLSPSLWVCELKLKRDPAEQVVPSAEGALPALPCQPCGPTLPWAARRPHAIIKYILGPCQHLHRRISDYFSLWQQEVWDKAFPILVPAWYEWPLQVWWRRKHTGMSHKGMVFNNAPVFSALSCVPEHAPSQVSAILLTPWRGEPLPLSPPASVTGHETTGTLKLASCVRF